MDARVAAALMDGPEARAPQMVVEGTRVRGRRVQVYDVVLCQWVSDLRGVTDPYWRDPEAEYQAIQRWPVGGQVPNGARQERAELTVEVVTEIDWYRWMDTKRRPEIRECPAIYVRVE